MSKAKEKRPVDTIMIGKKKFIRGMKKPSKLPKYKFPADFFAVEKKAEPVKDSDK